MKDGEGGAGWISMPPCRRPASPRPPPPSPAPRASPSSCPWDAPLEGVGRGMSEAQRTDGVIIMSDGDGEGEGEGEGEVAVARVCAWREGCQSVADYADYGVVVRCTGAAVSPEESGMGCQWCACTIESERRLPRALTAPPPSSSGAPRPVYARPSGGRERGRHSVNSKGEGRTTTETGHGCSQPPQHMILCCMLRRGGTCCSMGVR